MKLKKLWSVLLALPLLVAGCSCAKDGEYVEADKAEVFAYINEVNDENNFDMKGYEFSATAMGMVGMSGVYVSGTDGYQAKIEMETEEGTTGSVYIDGNTIYVNDGINKTYATIPEGYEEYYSFETALSMPKFEDLINLEQLEQLGDIEVYKMTKRKEGTTTYKIEGDLNEAEEGFEISMEIVVELTFKDDKLIGATYKFDLMGFPIKYSFNEYTGSIDFPSFADYVEDTTLLDEYQIGYPGLE